MSRSDPPLPHFRQQRLGLESAMTFLVFSGKKAFYNSHGPILTSLDVWMFTADLPIEWPGEMLTNRLLAEGCTRF